MVLRPKIIFPLLIALLLFPVTSALGQTTPETSKQIWPAVNGTIELRPQTRLQLSLEKKDGVDFSYSQWIVGAMVSYRMKRLVDLRRSEIDEENQYNLVIGAGYQYLRTKENSGTKNENRIIIQATPRYLPAAKFLLTDRNRLEFRWIDGQYNVRYRNKLLIDRPFRVQRFRFTPYASGELFYDRNHHSWNENEYAFGVQLPYRHRFMLDLYYLRKNCTTCSQSTLNVFGLTLNLYFRGKK